MSQGLESAQKNKNIYAIKLAEKRYFSIKNQIGVLIFPGRFCNLCPKLSLNDEKPNILNDTRRM